MPPVLRVTAIAAAALLGPSLAAASAAQIVIPQRGFPSPDTAITHMAQGVAAGDASTAIDAFAIDDAAEGFDFDRYVRRLLSIDPQTPSPSTSALYRELNRATLLGRAAGQLKNFAYGFLTRSPVDSQAIVLRSGASPARFRTSVDPKKLAGLTVVQVAPVPAPRVKDPLYTRTLRDQAAFWGADEASSGRAVPPGREDLHGRRDVPALRQVLAHPVALLGALQHHGDGTGPADVRGGVPGRRRERGRVAAAGCRGPRRPPGSAWLRNGGLAADVLGDRVELRGEGVVVDLERVQVGAPAHRVLGHEGGLDDLLLVAPKRRAASVWK